MYFRYKKIGKSTSNEHTYYSCISPVLVLWPIYQVFVIEDAFLFCFPSFKPSYNEHGDMQRGPVHVEDSDTTRNYVFIQHLVEVYFTDSVD